MLTVFEVLLVRQPEVLLELVGRGLLSPAFSLDGEVVRTSYTGRLRAIERLMAHDSYRRIRGAIRQVRWAG